MQASILPTMQDAMKVGDMFQLFLFTTQPLKSRDLHAQSSFSGFFVHFYTILPCCFMDVAMAFILSERCVVDFGRETLRTSGDL